ncbi:MAG: diadenylate cyclase CdaA [Clostridia bacterium]|nr:diadenylate cyclase CdaA [Clostridia bacterium]
MLEFFRTIGDFIITTVENFMWQDLIDIAFVAVIIYFVLKFIRDTRAAQLLKGIALVIILFQVAKLLNLEATTFILNSTLEFGLLAILIVFQPELRSLLERLGRTEKVKGLPFFSTEKKQSEAEIEDNISNIVDAVSNMSATKTGALLVVERNTKLGEVINTGTKVDSAIICDVILNIFYPKAPLHDGAAILRDGRIVAAGCFLPLTTKKFESDLGTRHRAGIGVSEISDSVVILVSEETGIISVAKEGHLQRRLTPDALQALLTKELMPQEKKKEPPLAHLWKGRSNKS